MDHLPIFCQLRDRDCLIVGGGDVAERKARLLLDAGARLTVNALAFIPQFTAWADAGMLTLVEGPFDESLLDTCWLAIAATDDDALNQRVSEAAEARRIFCNVVDAPKAASFIMPSIIDRSPLMVAVSSGGTSPVLARLLREKLESLLPLHLGQVAKYAGQLRGRVKQQFATMGERRRFWEKLFVNDRLAQSLANNDQKAITETTEQLINEPLDHRGEVVLVGAGPGDAGLLTLRGLQAIQQADVVFHDHLVTQPVLELVRRDTELICVGKRAGEHSVPQHETKQLLVEAAKAGKTVVRLKGGDPFIFGRGAEELQAAAEAGIPFQVVPGVTAAAGATAYAGIPLTQRDYAQSAVFVTGHYKPDSAPFDWSLLAKSQQTLAIYMGTMKAAEISAQLIAHGRDSDTPVAVISRGTRDDQQTITGTLQQLEHLAKDAPMPALLVVGEVVQLHQQLAWFQHTSSAEGFNASVVNLA